MSGKKNIEMNAGVLLVIATGIAAYYNSLLVPFIFDDRTSIIKNLRIRHLWPLRDVIVDSTKPITDLTFAINYALGGFSVLGYHAVNLIIHILAALVFFGIVHRTLLSESLRDHYSKEGSWIALSIALLWLVHPLQTESVTYIVQRAESLMGLFYFLTLYCLIRGVQSGHKYGWYMASVASCALGMGNKPVMATAPLAALIYDRIFLSRSFAEMFRKRLWLYLSLAATWSVLVVLFKVFYQYGQSGLSAGFTLKETTPIAYALIQPIVILHYLRLVFWPHPLVLDYYYWEISSWTIKSFVPPMVVIATLLLITIWALRYRPKLGFLGAWFFLILLPSSSFIPVADLVFEHRMYLPLAAVIVLAVIGGWNLLSYLIASEGIRRNIAIALIGILAITFGLVTIRRNIDYSSEISIWSDVVAKRPSNPRGYNNLGLAFFRHGRITEAIEYYKQALRLKPDYTEAHNNLGLAFIKQGRGDDAIAHYKEALRLQPDCVKASNNLGLALVEQGRVKEAIQYYKYALRLQPGYADAHNNLGMALAGQNQLNEAIACYGEAIRLDPEFAEAHNNLGIALAQQGRIKDAVSHCEKAIRIRPDYPEAHNTLANILFLQGRVDEAIFQYKEALRLDSKFAEARDNLTKALTIQRKTNIEKQQ